MTHAWLYALLGRAAGPPLDPSPDRARSLLRRELVRPEYHDRDLLQRVLDWVQGILDSGFRAASDASPLSGLAAVLVFLLLLVLLGAVLSRARRSARPAGPERTVFTEERLSAAQLRGRAEAALAAGRAEDAVIEGFRALTTRQIESGLIDDVPGATAHEVAESLGTTYPQQRILVADSANLFDLVLYGDRSATPEQAARVLSLDDELARVR